MIERTIASRYAQALFDIAQERGELERFGNEWQAVVDAINGDAQVRQVFIGRVISAHAKKELAEKSFTDNVDPVVLGLLCLIFDKSREEYLEAILDEYRRLEDEKNRVLNIKLVSAAELDASQEEALAKALGAATKKTARFEKSINPALIGGFVMTIGDTVFDGSVSGQLAKMQQQLVR